MNDSRVPVAVIGGGERFDALVALLATNEVDAVVWQPDGRGDATDSPFETVDLDALRDRYFIFLAVPFTRLREVARTIGDVVTARHAVVHSCHNLEAGSLSTASQVLVEETPTRRIGFVSGPMRSVDLRNGLPAAGVCASRFPEVCDLAEEALVHPGFRLYRSTDLVGAEHAAAYARVIAMAAGVASEMKLGLSVQATLFARGLAEVSRWVAARGGEERTTFGIAGAGNLHLDIAADGSGDYQVGVHAMRAGAFDPVEVRKTFGATGRDLLELITSLSDGIAETGMPAHILEACHAMVARELEPQQAVVHLMTLPTLLDE